MLPDSESGVSEIVAKVKLIPRADFRRNEVRSEDGDYAPQAGTPVMDFRHAIGQRLECARQRQGLGARPGLFRYFSRPIRCPVLVTADHQGFWTVQPSDRFCQRASVRVRRARHADRQYAK